MSDFLSETDLTLVVSGRDVGHLALAILTNDKPGGGVLRFGNETCCV